MFQGSQEDHVPVPPPVSPRLQEETSHSAPGRDRSLKIPPIVGIQPADENKKETSPNPTDELKKPKKQDLGKSKHKHKNLDLNVTGELFIRIECYYSWSHLKMCNTVYN